ncbi:uncharacterized protein [Antedon mediterranea]|uniref:uncharacterized protein n=1 Tax=Antedon mediterranea TaxID=105859 RepID=UPI003AF50FEE
MSEENAIKIIKKSLKALENMTSYNTKDAKNELQYIGDCYWNFEAYRKEVGEALAEGNAPELFIKILNNLSKYGYFKNDSVWFSAYYVFNNSWNFSDASLSFATALGDAGMVKLCSDILDSPQYRQKLEKSKNVHYLCKACLSILHNLSRSLSLNVYFRKACVVEKIKAYLEFDDFLKALTMMLIAAIIEEDQMDILKDTGTVEYLIESCEKAMRQKDRRYEGISIAELVEGLERLCINKANCKVVIDARGLETLKKILDFQDQTEQVLAIKAVWSLAFDEDYSRPILTKNTDIILALQKLVHSPNKEVRTSAQRALWVVKGNTEVTGTSKTNQKHEKHIMISYQWDIQNLVVKIKDALKECGYKIWIDLECMEGSTLQAMASAVENASTVIICITEKYKYSHNCRTEAEYAFQQNKKIVPLMMQPQYKPDGWLGMILGTKLYVDFRGQYDFQKQIPLLTKQIGSKKDSDVVTAVDIPDLGSKPGSGDAAGSQVSMMGWSRDEVQNWLENNHLQAYSINFSNFDGSTLQSFRNLRREAPEFFYNVLRNDLGFVDIVDLLKFTNAMDNL